MLNSIYVFFLLKILLCKMALIKGSIKRTVSISVVQPLNDYGKFQYNQKSRYTNPKHNKSTLLNKRANNSVDKYVNKKKKKTVDFNKH